MMFAILLPAPSTSASLCTAVVCFLAHAGSASIAIVGSLGAVPVKVTVPVIDDAANATPGHAAVSITPAARDNRVAVLRIVRLLREGKSRLSKLYTGPAFARHTTPERPRRRRLRAAGGPGGARPPPPRTTHPTAQTTPPPIATNAATSRSAGRTPSG